MQRILVATHGKPAADGALRVARALAERDGVDVDIVTVLPPFPNGQALRPPIHMRRPEHRRECEEHLLARVRAQIVRTGNDASRWDITLAHGQAARTIAKEAAERGSELIVLGIGKYVPADRVFGGEVALEVARWGSVPVLAVAPGSTGLPRHAVAATDFSRSSAYAARAALEVLEEGGRLSLIHVCPDVELPPDALRNWREHYHGVTEPLLARRARELAGTASASIELVQLDGDPAREILAFAGHSGADLVAAGTRGYHVVETILVGSVATAVLRGAHCSMLLAPSSTAAADREIVWRAEQLTMSGAR